MSKSKLFTFLLIFLSFSAIFSFYNFDSASAYTGTITYDSGTNTITCVGGSSSTPIGFNDIYEADLADNSWNVTEKQGSNQYLFYCKIILGDGTNNTYFSDKDKAINFNWLDFGVSNDEIMIDIKASTFVVFGTLLDEKYKSSYEGCFFSVQTSNVLNRAKLFRCDLNSSVYFYSCAFSVNTEDIYNSYIYIEGSPKRVYNSLCDNVRFYFPRNCDFFNIIATFLRTNAGLFSQPYKDTNTFEKIFCYNVSEIISSGYETERILKNIFGRNCTYIFRASNDGNFDYHLVDCDFDKWEFNFGSYAYYGKILRQYTFNLNVLNGEITDFVEGATVQLWKDSNLVYEGITNSSGMIPTQTLTLGYYQQSTGNAIQNASSPYYLVVTHPDWQTYISRFYITEPLRLTVSMQEPTVTGYTEAEKSDYTTIILFVISTILCIIGLALSVPLLPLISLTISVINIIFLSEPTIFNILLIVLNVTFTIIALVRAKTKNN